MVFSSYISVPLFSAYSPILERRFGYHYKYIRRSYRQSPIEIACNRLYEFTLKLFGSAREKADLDYHEIIRLKIRLLEIFFRELLNALESVPVFDPNRFNEAVVYAVQHGLLIFGSLPLKH